MLLGNECFGLEGKKGRWRSETNRTEGQRGERKDNYQWRWCEEWCDRSDRTTRAWRVRGEWRGRSETIRTRFSPMPREAPVTRTVRDEGEDMVVQQRRVEEWVLHDDEESI